ncbi:SGNH/GDSL hydrolase family protein [Paenibacillus dokdonensis]|uniref:SGNH/GDSL hydrolase family protein n=1 Tax=Paenibacillus dokdonensis TaxID=2567944 RepID=UPI0010A876AC|nr:SGNH/GDSL hydrolase family protein [Paenibacillus dokdonensis]
MKSENDMFEHLKSFIQTTGAPATFIFTGDDIAVGTDSASGYRNYIQHFEERIRWEIAESDGPSAVRRQNFVFNTGLKSCTAKGLLSDFRRRVIGLRPQVVFIMLGMEDAAQSTPIDEFKLMLKAMVFEIRGIGAVPVLQTSIFPIHSDFVAMVSPYVEAIKAVSLHDKAVLINHFDTWRSNPKLCSCMGPDRMQLSELGHLKLAKELMTLFGVGGSGFTWNISGFTGIKEPIHQGTGQEIISVPAEISKLIHGSKPVTWLFSGDSITHGALHTMGHKSFVELFEERVRKEMAVEQPARAKDIVLNTGVSGMTTQDLLTNFDRWLAWNEPNVAFLAFGMNDCRLVPIERFEANLRTAIAKIRKFGAIPILQTVNTIKSDDESRYANLPAYVNAIRKVSKIEDVLLIDHYQYWSEAEKNNRDLKSRWLNDPIHPNEEGMVQMAVFIFKSLGMVGPDRYKSNLRYEEGTTRCIQ